MFNASYQDIRVKKIVLLDPAQGSALREGSLSSVALPSLIVGATHNDFLPWKNHGERYAAGIPNAQTISLNGQEGHFVFLTPCQHKTQVMGVSLCEDRPGVDRAAVQRDLAQWIVDFVKLDNEPSTIARHPEAPARADAGVRFAHGGFFQVLLYTPPWVFALLVGLCVFGLMQARARHVSVWLALLLPAAMPVLSLSGVVLYVGAWPPALAAWTLGLGAFCILCLRSMDPRTVRYDAASQKLAVSGSWIPLLVILGIFSIRYAMGVARAMDLEIVRDRNIQLAASFLLGAFSGFFLARGLMFWRASSTRSSKRPFTS